MPRGRMLLHPRFDARSPAHTFTHTHQRTRALPHPHLTGSSTMTRSLSGMSGCLYPRPQSNGLDSKSYVPLKTLPSCVERGVGVCGGAPLASDGSGCIASCTRWVGLHRLHQHSVRSAQGERTEPLTTHHPTHPPTHLDFKLLKRVALAKARAPLDVLCVRVQQHLFGVPPREWERAWWMVGGSLGRCIRLGGGLTSRRTPELTHPPHTTRHRNEQTHK